MLLFYCQMGQFGTFISVRQKKFSGQLYQHIFRDDNEYLDLRAIKAFLSVELFLGVTEFNEVSVRFQS